MLGLFQHHWCGRVRAEDLPDLGEGNLGASLGSGKMQPALLWAFFFFLLNCTDLSVAKKLCVQFPLHH